MSIRVLVVEDEPGFRRRFCEAVLTEPLLSLCGAAASVAQACALFDLLRPEVVLVGVRLPDGRGAQVVRHALADRSTRDVIVMFDKDDNVIDAIRAGATGYVLKETSRVDIASSILQARAGGSPISPLIARQMLENIREDPQAWSARGRAPVAPVNAAHSMLSKRETEILRAVAKGLDFKTVGAVLAISHHTVITHTKRIYEKLAVHSRGEAVYEAKQMGLL